ncbi:hypothetical protein Ahy_B10g104950 isoform B [Arachis hypogaea]|nr:hypothetical protein Ahy_B10g104950 isoform B [Arachis hypogaea]
MIEVYVEFEQQSGMSMVGDKINVDEFGDIDWEEDNNDSEDEFEANYEFDDENDDGDLAGNPAVQDEANAIVSPHPFGVPSFMRTLDLEAMHAPEFSEYANTSEGNVAAEDGEFSVGMEFGSRESVISVIKSYTISRGVDYTVYESEPQTFYTKCKGHATKGRPKSTRYVNEMDSRDMRGPRRCTTCGREGHSRSRCLQRAGPSSAGGH